MRHWGRTLGSTSWHAKWVSSYSKYYIVIAIINFSSGGTTRFFILTQSRINSNKKRDKNRVGEVPFFVLSFRIGWSRTAATSKMERFAVIVNGFQPLTIITKYSILDVAAVLDLPKHSNKSFLFPFLMQN